jgi:acetate---CoA ligase (ADP-forming)
MTPDEAVAAADRLGYPVVLKVHEASIVHKTEVLGVRLDLRGADEVREAFGDVVKGHRPPWPSVRLTPYRPGGAEVLAGARRHQDFGPLLVVGAGGVAAETIGEVAIRTLPCATDEIVEMLDETRLSRLLAGRGAPPADREALVAALAALSRLILTLPQVSDVEVNPLRCDADGCVALDARVLVEA